MDGPFTLFQTIEITTVQGVSIGANPKGFTLA